MLAKDAKAVARHWVMAEARCLPGFYGAFFHGSTNWLPDDAVLPRSSDVDIMVVLAVSPPTIKLGKLFYNGVLLDVSYVTRAELESPDHILGVSHMAGSFRLPSIIMDPSGDLTALQIAVAKDYAKWHWVRARCQHVVNKILGNFETGQESALFHDQVTGWLFGTGLTTHMLLVAGLKNPTVRQRYGAARQLLIDYGYGDVYETLLELLGCAQLSRMHVEKQLAALIDIFDVTQTVIKTQFFFASDISAVARPIVVEGSQALIERGFHREAIFWIAVTYSRCQKVLYHDAPIHLQERFTPGYQELLYDLGIRSGTDLQHRSEAIKQFLPRLWEVAEGIMVANPDIQDRPTT